MSEAQGRRGLWDVDSSERARTSGRTECYKEFKGSCVERKEQRTEDSNVQMADGAIGEKTCTEKAFERGCPTDSHS